MTVTGSCSSQGTIIRQYHSQPLEGSMETVIVAAHISRHFRGDLLNRSKQKEKLIISLKDEPKPGFLKFTLCKPHPKLITGNSSNMKENSQSNDMCCGW